MFSEFLNNIILYPFFVTLVRLTGIFLTVPVYADKAVSAKVRLSIALVFSIALAPIVSEYVPTIPKSVSLLILVVLGEFLIGILLGFGAKLFMLAMNIAGDFMAAMMGLQAASMMDPRSGSNTTTLSSMLSLIALAAFLSMDFHLYIIRAFIESYNIIGFNKAMDLGEVAMAIIATVSKVTVLGVKIASPIVVANFIVNCALGILNRLVPQIHVFFISMPLTMLIGIFILVLTLASMLILFTEEIENNLIIFAQEIE
ncbi:MAG TPA: flagellar biosynthetic protein FliR [Alphaproteobacteria bacterium]|mgnify:CR=1 FL=1|nr:flagellar biosynthetic protein FliR [Alphaproteobacteria bacterium]